MKQRIINKGFEASLPSAIKSDRKVFSRCVGMVDGTLIVFKEKPALGKLDSMSYFNYRKQKYGFQATVICDDECRILKFNTNFPGAVHDSRAWRKLGVYQRPRDYLQGGEFLLADSAYPLTEYTIVPFKRSAKPGVKARLSPEKKLFNRTLSGLRVSVEHCIGRLKARFPSLRNLPHRIRSKDDVGVCLRWIGSCVILHNLLIDLDDEMDARWTKPEDIEEDEEDEDEDGDTHRTRRERVTGKKKRNALMLAILEECNSN